MTAILSEIAVLGDAPERTLVRMAERGAFTVWVFGGGAEDALALEQALPGNATLGVLGERLNAAADRIAEDLLNLDRQVLPQDADVLAWNASLIADRSPYAGDLQRNAAGYMAMHDILASGGRHLFFVESAEVAWTFAQTAKANGIDLSCRCRGGAGGYARQALRTRVGALLRHFRQAQVLRTVRRSRPVPWDALKGCDVLLLDWAHANTFEPTAPTATANHLGVLPDMLRRAGLKVGFIANPLAWVHDFAAIAHNSCAAHDPVVLVNELTGLRAILRGAWRTWRMSRRLKRRAVLGGVDVSPVFERERVKDLCRPQSTEAFAFSAIGQALMRHGIAPKAVVYPYEHQGLERALQAGLHEHCPGVRGVACQSAPLAARYLGFIPSRATAGSTYFADHLIAMGPWYADLLTAHGVPAGRMSIGGSLRFEAVQDTPPLARGEADAQEGQTVLIGTSVEFEESADLVIKACKALKHLPGVQAVVNFHPVVDETFKARIERCVAGVLGDEAGRVRLSEENVRGLMAQADVLLYNNSGVAFEARILGLLAVNVSVDCQVSYDKVPANISRTVSTSDELTDFLRGLFDNPGDYRVHADPTVGGCVGRLEEAVMVDAVLGTNSSQS